jgi:hypothetical protein
MGPKRGRRLHSSLVGAKQTAEALVASAPPSTTRAIGTSVEQAIAEPVVAPLAVIVRIPNPAIRSRD